MNNKNLLRVLGFTSLIISIFVTTLILRAVFGSTMNVENIVLIMPLIGLILGIIAVYKSKKANYKNISALIGLTLNSLIIILLATAMILLSYYIEFPIF